jgi:methionyl-tRNA formyltransferase
MTNKKIIFWGTPLFSLPSLEELYKLGIVSAVVTRASKPAGRGRQISDSPVKIWSEQHRVPVLAFTKLDDDFILELKKYLPATFVVVAYGKMIKQDILDLSELLAINLHPSRLPEFRGPSPIQAAILAGLDKTAVTIIQLDDKMDHGPVIDQEGVLIQDNDTFATLSDVLSKKGAKLLHKNIIAYLNGELKPTAQNDSKATICSMIQKEDGLINWAESAKLIRNKIRAYNPWPSAYTKLFDTEIKILSVKITNKKLKSFEIEIQRDQLFIGTGTDALEILELQAAGKKSMLASDYIRGLRKK